MANDGGMAARLEDWLASVFDALTYNDQKVFKTAEPWRHQVAVTKSGMEAFERYAPFAFPSFAPVTGKREGDFDLNQKLQFSVLLGTISREDGVARRGDASHLGISKLRELVIAAIDKTHPGEGFDCDDFHYQDELEIFDAERKYMLEMQFYCNWLMTD